MKKLLTLLFLICSFLSFGQHTINMEVASTVTQVGDTLYMDVLHQGNSSSPKLAQFDFQYNNKLLALQSRTWLLTSTSAQKAYNSWNGYKWGGTPTTDIDGQYADYVAGTTVYSTNADWSVERITVQDVTTFSQTEYLIRYKFTIKDKGTTNYSDYSNIMNINWGYLKESDGTAIATSGETEGGETLTLNNIQGGAAGNVTLNVKSNIITNNIGDGTHFSYYVYNKSDIGAQNQVNEGATVVAQGTFDASGQATVTGLENDTEYFVWIYVDATKTYLDNAVTVSDLALIFTEAIGAGSSPNGSSTTFDYKIQSFLGNVIHTAEFDNVVDFDDSYSVLAHLQGVTQSQNTFITKTGSVFNTGGRTDKFGKEINGSILNGIDASFTPTDSNKSFEFAHAVNGDVNFSHSYQPPATADFQISGMVIGNSSSLKTNSFNTSKYQAVDANIDLVSQIVNGKVEFKINSQVAGMIGSQFNIVYDKTRIQLEDVIFDTGNQMTNFANHIEEEGKINIGSFDQNFEQTVKVGTPYKLIFKPLVELQNASGLVTFKVHEGVKADGTQINLRME